MYTHNDHYLKFCILRSIVLIIQNVCKLDFLQLSTSEALWTVVKTLLHRQKRLLCLTINSVPQKHSGLMNETFWTQQLSRQRHENR